MIPSDSIRRRLALIKYIYDVAVEQSQKPEPLCSMSILTFHDAIDLFLGLSLEYLDIDVQKGKKIYFMDYWDHIPQLSHKVAMQELNDTRVSFKHHSNVPSRSTVDINRNRAGEFLNEQSMKIFGVDFSKMSLVDIVQCEEAREHLKNAETMLEGGQIEQALSNIGMAFVRLIDDYEERKRGEFGGSPFFFGRSMDFLSGSSVVGRGVHGLGRLADFVDKTVESIESLQEAVKIMSLGINYRRYAKFRLFTPRITHLAGGGYHDHGFHWGSRGIPTVDDVRFCINFVIESAITLQEFDFSLK